MNLRSEPQIPILDMDAWLTGTGQSRTEFAQNVGRVCHEIGFFYIVNHGLEESFLEQYMQALKTFFALPDQIKKTIDKSNSPHFRGWEKLGSELTGNQIDYREQLDVGIDRDAIENPNPFYMHLVGPNQWPAEQVIPGFRQTTTEFIEKMAKLSRELLRIFSLSLGMPVDYIENKFCGTQASYVKLIRYPKTLENSLGVGVHKDSGFLTLVLQDKLSGLEARSIHGEWLPVPPVAGSLVVNMGELLQMMTHNYFIASPHRVSNQAEEPRYSSAFFYCPDLNTRLDPMPIDESLIAKAQASEHHRSAGFMASRAEMEQGVGGIESKKSHRVFGHKHWERWVRSYPDIAKQYYPDLVY